MPTYQIAGGGKHIKQSQGHEKWVTPAVNPKTHAVFNNVEGRKTRVDYLNVTREGIGVVAGEWIKSMCDVLGIPKTFTRCGEPNYSLGNKLGSEI